MHRMGVDRKLVFSKTSCFRNCSERLIAFTPFVRRLSSKSKQAEALSMAGVGRSTQAVAQHLGPYLEGYHKRRHKKYPAVSQKSSFRQRESPIYVRTWLVSKLQDARNA